LVCVQFDMVPLFSTFNFQVLNQPLSTFILHRPLLLTLTYLSSRLHPNALFSLFGLLTIEAKWWPYVLVAMDGVMGGKTVCA
jgi:Derlin-2/3